MKSWSKRYLQISAIIFLITGAVKFISATKSVAVLNSIDPVFGFSTRWIFFLAGGWEISLGVLILINSIPIRSHIMVLWTAVMFMSYRIILHLMGGDKLCPCLGSSTEWLKWSHQTTNVILWLIITYLMCGSSLFLLSNHITTKK